MKEKLNLGFVSLQEGAQNINECIEMCYSLTGDDPDSCEKGEGEPPFFEDDKSPN